MRSEIQLPKEMAKELELDVTGERTITGRKKKTQEKVLLKRENADVIPHTKHNAKKSLLGL